jgi:heptosyltransferase-2
MATKVLIIKLGYSETLDQEIGRVPSLGDVIRTTPILYGLKERFPDCHITWLVSAQAEPLLNGNKMIDRIIVWDEFVPFQLMREKFDVLINLEKIAGLCAISDMIDAWVKYGFRFESINGSYSAYERGLSFIKYIEEKEKNRKFVDYWEKVLIEMLGVEWKGQECILGYKPKSQERFDIGLNFNVGSKWPTKAMPKYMWEILADMLKSEGYSISWQEGLKDLYEYMDWINSCRLLISQDSLGVHIAISLKKNIVGLFGPTDPLEIHYDKITSIYSEIKCDNMPCYKPGCQSGLNCMSMVDLNKVVRAVKKRLSAPSVEVIKCTNILAQQSEIINEEIYNI